jgi:putative ABC transport system permease protein
MTAAQIRENIGEAFESVRSHKGRSFLTLLGIVIGVASVIGVAAIIEGLNRDVVGRVQALGSKVFFVSRMPAGFFGGRLPEAIRLRKHFKYADARVIQESCPTVESATAIADRAAFTGDQNEIRYENEQVTDFFLRGMDHNFAATFPMFETEEGRFFSRYDHDHARFVVVLGQGVANSLFPLSDPVGRTVRLNGMPFEVIGTFLKDEGLLGGPGVDQMVGIPYGTFHKLYPEIEEHRLAISVRDTGDLSRALDEVVAALRRLRKVPPTGENDFDIVLPSFLEDLWSQLTSALFLLTFTISSIALLVGGIGVMNIMLVSVTQRTREIGVRKAVGARKADIRLQFLIEALGLTAAGGAIGVVVGAIIAAIINFLYPSFPVYLSPFWVAVALAMSAGVGLFFGYYPANRAAELDPITCLRYE